MNDAKSAEGVGRAFALVTGASAGIGAEFARQLAASGHNLILVARRGERLVELGQELAARYGIRSEALAADLANRADLGSVCSAIAARTDIEVLINNAGFGVPGRLSEAESGALERQTLLHTLAPMKLAHSVLPQMVERGRGAIVNVSSVAAFVPAPGTVNYHATKAYEVAMCVALALELRNTGVYVQALCPGFTHTEFHAVSGFDKSRIPKSWWMGADFVVRASLREMEKRDRRGVPRGRVIVVPGCGYRLGVNLLSVLPRSWVWAASRFRPGKR